MPSIRFFHKKAKEVAELTGFKLGKRIYQGNYYAKGKVRNAIFSGVYQGRPAVLKIYLDPRFTDEPKSQIAFSRANTSKVLVAPKVYKYKIESPHQGWFIMEKLPPGSFFTQPVKDKEEFAYLYLSIGKISLSSRIGLCC